MAFSAELQSEIRNYVYSHLPDEEWYDTHFYSFIRDKGLRDRLIVEFKNARIIYKIFEGLQASDELLLAQIKTQVIMYVSIQEAVINYVLFNILESSPEVQALLYQERLVNIMIPTSQRAKLQKALEHDGKEILTYYKELKPVDRTKIRYDQKISASYQLNLLDEHLMNDLIKLYEYRNTVHIEAELRKNLDYNLEMGLLAFRRVEGLSMQLSSNLKEKFMIS